MQRHRATVLVVGILLAGACGHPPYWRGETRAPTVAVVGDSYVGQLESFSPTYPDSSSAFTRALAAEGWRGHVDGESGWPTRRVIELARTAVAEDAEAIVVVAGVNDVAWATRQRNEAWAQSIVEHDVSALLQVASVARCVVWPTVAPSRSGPGRINRTVRTINAVLRAAADDGVLVPEWGRQLRTHPDWIGPDGLHLSDLGEERLQAVVIDALHRCLDRR